MTNATTDPRILCDEELATGKTVLRAEHCGRFAAVVFTDGTALVFEVERDYEDVSIELRTFMPNTYDAMLCGLITREEYDSRRTAEIAAEATRKEAADRALYEQLRRRFDVDGGNAKPSTAAVPSKP